MGWYSKCTTALQSRERRKEKKSPTADRNTAPQTQKSSASLCWIFDCWQEAWSETKRELQTFFSAVLLRGRWHWVSCSGEGTHYWQGAWPVIPGPAAGDWSRFQSHLRIVKGTVSFDVKGMTTHFNILDWCVRGSFYSGGIESECHVEGQE